tara:strand:+ start:16948 stop:17556 length:609 start_codon:yes stop_codon:yes gene_type:complete
MKKIILFLIVSIFLIFTIQAFQEHQIYYKLNLDYSYGNISISSVEIEFFQGKIENYFGLYTVRVLDYNDKILNLTFFDVPNEIIWEGINLETGEINMGGLLELNETSFEIFVPYYENAKEIIIYNESLYKLTKKDINEFSRQGVEVSGEVIRDEEKRVEDREKVPEIKSLIDKLSEYWWVLLVVLIILIIVLFYSLSKKKIS